MKSSPMHRALRFLGHMAIGVLTTPAGAVVGILSVTPLFPFAFLPFFMPKLWIFPAAMAAPFTILVLPLILTLGGQKIVTSHYYQVISFVTGAVTAQFWILLNCFHQSFVNGERCDGHLFELVPLVALAGACGGFASGAFHRLILSALHGTIRAAGKVRRLQPTRGR